MRRFIIALIAFFLPFVIVAVWRRLKAESAPPSDSRVWIIGCLLCAASFAAAALLERSHPSGHYVETHDAKGHPVSVYRDDP